jgi:hypothetical protein
MAHPFEGLRLSDGDRTRARKRLVREHRRGRIDATELEERLDAVATARSHGDLAPVFADLDPYAAARGGGPGPRGRRYRPARSVPVPVPAASPARDRDRRRGHRALPVDRGRDHRRRTGPHCAVALEPSCPLDLLTGGQISGS